MTKEKKNLTPWQQKNLEYQRKQKAENATRELPKRFAVTKFFNEKLEEDIKEHSNRIKEKQKETTLPEESAENIKLEAESQDFSDSENESYEEAYNKFMSQSELSDQEGEEKESFFQNKWLLLKPILRKMWPFLSITSVIFLFSIYAVSPLSKIGKFSVTGNEHETAVQIAKASTLKTGDTVIGILRNKRNIEQTIDRAFPRISNAKLIYHFPNQFEMTVAEHKNEVYVQQNSHIYLALDNGYIVKNQTIDAKKLKKMPLLISFTDSETREFIQAYKTLKPSLRALITRVTKTPTKATKDFIAINMSDGNQVRVPLDQMADKLPYYPSVAKQVKAPQVVDMEAGIYATSKSQYLKELSSASSSGTKTGSSQTNVSSVSSTTASAN